MKFKKGLVLCLAVLMAFSVFAGCSAKKEPAVAFDWTAYDELIAKAKASTDFVEREALLHQAEDMLMDTGAIVPLYFYNDVYMMKPSVKGFYTTVYGTKYFMYATNGSSDTLRINLASEPDKLDPALNSSVDGACLAANSFEGLYTYNSKGKVVPALAKSSSVSKDGLTYTITLKSGLKWSNGDPLTAEDFVYSWNRAINPSTAADYEYMFSGIEGYDSEEKVLNVKADGNKLIIKLTAPCAYFYDLLAFPTFFPVHKATVESAAGYKDEEGNVLNAGAWATEAGFVSNGAYTLKEWTHNESMVYVKNPNYWNADNVKLEELHFMLSADDTAIYSAYQAGDLDFIDTVPNSEIPNLRDNKEFYIADNLGTYYVSFNVTSSNLFGGMEPEKAATLRKALSLLINRDYIIETAALTDQEVATSFIPSGMADGHGGVFKANDKAYTYEDKASKGYYSTNYEENYQKGIELLKSIGYEFDENGKLVEPIKFEYLVNTGTAHEAIGQCMQQDFARAGIEMTIKTVEWDVFLNDRKEGNYDIARNGWLADFNDPINMLEMWTTTSGNNDCQFGRFE